MLDLWPYVEGNRFTERTDQDALKWMLNRTNTEGLLARWRLSLTEYDFDIQYRPGTKHQFTDTLARATMTGVDTSSLEDEIPCFSVTSGVEESYLIEYLDIIDEMMQEFLECISVSYGLVNCFTVLPDLWVEPITIAEWLREQSTDSYYQTVRKMSRRASCHHSCSC